MEIEELRKVANPLTGLVALKITRAFMPYDVGQVAGFPPEVAKGYLDVGSAELHKTSKSDVKDPMLGMTGPPPGSHGASILPHSQALTDRRTIYDGRPEVSPRAQAAPSTTQDPASKPEPAKIPDNWQEMDGAELRKLAANLSGKSYQALSVEASKVLIEAAIKGEPAPPTSSDENTRGAPTTAI